MSEPTGGHHQHSEGDQTAQAGANSTVYQTNNNYYAPPDRPPGTFWNVPFERNTAFTGREEELAELHRRLRTEGAAGLTQRLGVTGLGGVGKTQTAVEYAHRFHADYTAVFWVRAETESDLTAGFAEIAGLVDPEAAKQPDASRVGAAARGWLNAHPGWLLVCDNADDPEVLARFRLPTHPNGRVLVTSRATHLDVLGIPESVELDVFPPEKALKFLLERTGRTQPSTEEQRCAKELAEELGGLPLALEQAAAYMKTRKGTTFAAYLAAYRKQPLDVLEKQGPLIGAGEVPRSVATTWLLNIQAVETASSAAADVLRLCAFLSPAPIPVEVLTSGAADISPDVAEALVDADDPLALQELLQPLTQYSLIRCTTAADGSLQDFTVHRLVQSVQRQALDPEARQGWQERAVLALNLAFPGEWVVANWPLCDRLLTHVRHVASFIGPKSAVSQAGARLLNQAGFLADERAEYTVAESLHRQALEIRQEVLGLRHPSTARSLNNLACVLRNQGKLADAEPLYRQALAVRQEVLGLRHPDTATNLNGLASLLQEQGNLAEAEPLYRQALKILREVLGSRHPDTAPSLNNLALLLHNQDKLADAEPLYRQALAVRQEVLGTRHPETAQSLNNLASLLQAQGKPTEAEPLFRQALEICQDVLGPDHPDTRLTRANLEALLEEMGAD